MKKVKIVSIHRTNAICSPMKELSGPQRKFCEGIVSGLNQTEAYKAAYPKTTEENARKNAARFTTNDGIKTTIAAMRAKADELAGSGVMTLKEKREFMALVKRTAIGDIDETSPLCQERTYIVGEEQDSVKVKMVDKLKAIQIDNDLSGDGAEATGNKALAGIMALAMRLRK